MLKLHHTQSKVFAARARRYRAEIEVLRCAWGTVSPAKCAALDCRQCHISRGSYVCCSNEQLALSLRNEDGALTPGARLMVDIKIWQKVIVRPSPLETG